MAKFTASLVILAALCYIAEGATISEGLAAINIQGAAVRVEAIRKIHEAANAARASGLLTPEQAACVGSSVRLAMAEVNKALVPVQHQLRLTLVWNQFILAGLSVEELNAEIRQRQLDVVNPVVDRFTLQIKGCVA